MKWIVNNKSYAVVTVFNLIENNILLETLRYNPVQQSIRIASAGQQSVFFTEKIGFRNNLFLFKNEYGFTTGKIIIDSTHTAEGVIQFGEENIQYTLRQTPVAEIVIYGPDGLKPKEVCGLQLDNDNLQMDPLNNKISICAYACLVWGFCWYLHNAATKENSINYTQQLSLA